LLAFPPVVRGHAGAGDDPVLAAAVGAVVGVALGRTDAVAVGEVEDAAVGLVVREADGFGVAVGEVATSG
jgi:hypothetical protein